MLVENGVYPESVVFFLVGEGVYPESAVFLVGEGVYPESVVVFWLERVSTLNLLFFWLERVSTLNLLFFWLKMASTLNHFFSFCLDQGHTQNINFLRVLQFVIKISVRFNFLCFAIFVFTHKDKLGDYILLSQF